MTREEFQKIANERLANEPEFKKAYEEFVERS